MSADQRTKWWINRLGRATALLASIPGLGGALVSRLPVQDMVGIASQGVLLCAIAGEHGVTDQGELVRLLGWVLFGRNIDPRLAGGDFPEHDPAEEEARAAELTRELADGGRRRISLKGLAVTLWRLGRSLSSISDEMAKRPRGRLWHRAFGLIPGVGLIAAYLGERSALKRAAKRARRWRERQATRTRY
jgi:hypothetical protein